MRLLAILGGERVSGVKGCQGSGVKGCHPFFLGGFCRFAFTRFESEEPQSLKEPDSALHARYW